jgi:tetratricopeptide (TPR) repeat protein
MPLHMQAVAARMGGDLSQARALYEESIELNRRLGQDRMVAVEHHNLAYVELHDGQRERAAELFKRARSEARRVGHQDLDAYLVGDLAVMAAANGELTAAARFAGSAAAAFKAAGQVPDPDDAAEQEGIRALLARNLSPDELHSLYEEGAKLAPRDILDEVDR